MSVNFTNLDHFGILMPKKDWCLWLNWHLPFFFWTSVICFQENKPKILEPSVGSSGRPEEKSTSSFIHSTLVLIIQRIPLYTLSPSFPFTVWLDSLSPLLLSSLVFAQDKLLIWRWSAHSRFPGQSLGNKCTWSESIWHD